MAFDSPLPASDERDRNADILSKTPTVTSVDLNPYRTGTYRHSAGARQRTAVPVPHPQHVSYSSIEGAKRRRAESDRTWWQNKQRELHREDINHQRWIRPMTEHAFQIHRPNIHGWNRVLHMRGPEW
jgi:hypothetical protein